MKIVLVTDDGGISALVPGWQALWSRTSLATPFQSPAWMLAWWSCFGTGRPVIAAAVAGADKIMGLLGCYLLGAKLLPIGAGLSDYQDALIAPEAPSETSSALLEATLIEAGRLGAETADLTDLPWNAALRLAGAPPSWRGSLIDTDVCPVLSVPPQARDLRAVVPAGRVRDIAQASHRAERAGGFTCEEAEIGTVMGALDALDSLHASRWRSLGQGGVLADPRVRAFHRRAAPDLLRAGALRLTVLRIGDELAAACYGLLASGRLFLYLSGFEPNFAFMSPGTILLGRMIATAIEEGRREIHFLRGDERYKFAWGAQPRHNAMRKLVRW